MANIWLEKARQEEAPADGYMPLDKYCQFLAIKNKDTIRQYGYGKKGIVYSCYEPAYYANPIEKQKR